MKGLGRNTRFKKSKDYSEGGKVKKRAGGPIEGPARGTFTAKKVPPIPQRGYGQAVNSLPGRAVGGTTTEVGKQAQSYKEYVKKTFGGGKT